MGRLRVLLATEGTYPFHKGGVSTWCHVLTNNLPEIDFTLLAVMMHPYLRQQYQLATNVRALLKVPLWGIEEPAEYSWHFPFSTALKIKTETSDRVIAREFLPVFERFLHAVLVGQVNNQVFGEYLLALHLYFQLYDYHKTMKAGIVWETFQQVAHEGWRIQRSADMPTLAEQTEALRLLYRFLLVLHFPVPPTDITHSAAAAFCGLPCILAKLAQGTPYLLTEHGVYLREQYLNLNRHIPSFFVRWFLYRLIGAVVRANYYFADQISPVCAFNTRWEKWWEAPPERIKVIYNGADPARFRPLESTQKTRPLVVNIGLIFPLKGTADLIDAAALVRKEISDVEFRLYGSASDAEYLAECQRRVHTQSLQQTVIFAGTTSEPWHAYSEADVVALASISEGFPYVVIEAMLSGAAIVATDVGGVREALADTGLLVRPHHPIELAEAITALLKSPTERIQLGKRARARALQYFTQARFLDEYRESYQRLSRREPVQATTTPHSITLSKA
ncbi:MAG: GT4 family glycosyltransferase PelF [Acidobacteriota bacterium]